MSVERAPRQIPPRRKMKALAALGDGRTALAQVRHEIKDGLTSDLGADLSTAQTILVERAALLTVFCRHAEARWLAEGGTVDIDASYFSACGALKRLLDSVGLERVPKPVPTLQEYLEAKAAKAAKDKAP
jgi:hypothetical protein